MFIDARIPVVFGITPQEHDALLVPDGLASGLLIAAPGHLAGCPCCVARGPTAAAFDRLFLGRVRGTVPWFTRVVVAQDDPAVRATIANDPVVSTRFRLA